ncbi:hypothetical protein Tco_1113918 [Tanacetum coccineum]|uniref:Uncharacterized protein n=1 Tax=Tanacetum coccineum TaxID=301880 RepID=A0ABQ5IV36_9ASTR
MWGLIEEIDCSSDEIWVAILQSPVCTVFNFKCSWLVVDEFVDEGVPAAKPSLEDTEEAILQKVLQESLTDAYPTQRGPLPPVVFREPNTGKLQPLPEVPGKGKEKVGEEQAAQVLLNLQTPKKKSSAEQYILQSRSQLPTVTASREESSSLYAELGLSDSDTESDEGMPSVGRSGTQDEGQAGSVLGTPDEGQAGSDPGTRDKGQAGTNPDNAAESLPLPTSSVHAGPNLEHSNENLKLTVDEQVIPEEPVSSTGTLSSLQHLAKDFSFGDQFLNDKPSEADNEKTTADTEAESMVSITIQQDTSIIPPMTSPVIDLVSRPESPNVHWPLPTTTITTAAPTTTTTLPLPPQLQQSSSETLLIKRMGELEQYITDRIEENQTLESRLDNQGSRIHKLETKDWAKQRITISSYADMKEFLRQTHLVGWRRATIDKGMLTSGRHMKHCGTPPSAMKELLATTEPLDSAHAPPSTPPGLILSSGRSVIRTTATKFLQRQCLAEYLPWTNIRHPI